MNKSTVHINYHYDLDYHNSTINTQELKSDIQGFFSDYLEELFGNDKDFNKTSIKDTIEKDLKIEIKTEFDQECDSQPSHLNMDGEVQYDEKTINQEKVAITIKVPQEGYFLNEKFDFKESINEMIEYVLTGTDMDDKEIEFSTEEVKLKNKAPKLR